MFLVFIDESGSVYASYEKCRDRKGSALLVVGSLGIRESQLGMIDHWFRETINAKAKWPADFGSYLVNVPMFGQSHLHQALQLADIVSHSTWRYVNKDDSLNWFGQLHPFLAKHWSTGDIINAGLTFIE